MVFEKQAGRDSWDIPAGGLKNGETPEQALKRELCEEIGLKIDHGFELYRIIWDSQNSPTIHFLYTTNIDDIAFKSLKANTPDINKIASFSKPDIRKLLDNKEYEHELAKNRLEIYLNNEPKYMQILHLPL